MIMYKMIRLKSYEILVKIYREINKNPKILTSAHTFTPFIFF